MNHQTPGKQEFPNRETLKKRAQLNRNIRQFFNSAGYLEVETPLLSPAVIPETSIEYFAADFINEFIGSRELYLLPSPEIYMKRLLAQGMGNIFQIGKCFRNGEELSRLHNPEFTMLEWYTVQADYEDSIALTREFLQQLPVFSNTRGSAQQEDIFKPLEVITMQELIQTHAGFDLTQY
ncbi:MAG: LysR family transcriptional regulator, partial [Spirochaetales bacterium]|nr:LysR family transcriptional regulator [Spirochaetales bacterium]